MPRDLLPLLVVHLDDQTILAVGETSLILGDEGLISPVPLGRIDDRGEVWRLHALLAALDDEAVDSLGRDLPALAGDLLEDHHLLARQVLYALLLRRGVHLIAVEVAVKENQLDLLRVVVILILYLVDRGTGLASCETKSQEQQGDKRCVDSFLHDIKSDRSRPVAHPDRDRAHSTARD